MGKPQLPDIATLIAAGIDPKTGLPKKLEKQSQRDTDLKCNVRRILRIQDEQRAVNSFKWYNLPAGISSQELERLIYLKYTLCFFYFAELKQFFFMPYALDGTIDFYGRFNTIHPVPMTAGSEKEAEKEMKTAEYKQKAALLSNKKLEVLKDVVVLASEITKEKLENSAVIIRDYTNQMGQAGEPRYLLNDNLLDLEADCICFMRTNLLIGTGIQGMRVMDADSANQVDSAAKELYHSALVGNPYTAIIGDQAFQELQPSSTLKASEYFLAMQSIDNFLLTTHGIENTGIYEKKAHILESENQVNATNVSLTLQDRLAQRQDFCNKVNSLWGLGMWCEISETVSGIDLNQDGIDYDESSDGAGSGHSVEEGGEE